MKLVRNLIPELDASEVFRYRKTRDSIEHQHLFFRKLAEEVGEVMDTTTKDELLRELADVLEVVYAHAALLGADEEEMHVLRTVKTVNRGSFSEGWVLLGPGEE